MLLENEKFKRILNVGKVTQGYRLKTLQTLMQHVNIKRFPCHPTPMLP